MNDDARDLSVAGNFCRRSYGFVRPGPEALGGGKQCLSRSHVAVCLREPVPRRYFQSLAMAWDARRRHLEVFGKRLLPLFMKRSSPRGTRRSRLTLHIPVSTSWTLE